jgi:hypothetical protein
MSKSVTRPGSDEEWEELMRQLRAQPKAHPRPFFYTRVQARLKAEEQRESRLLNWLRRPAYLVLLGALILAVSGDGTALPPVAAVNQYDAPHFGPPTSLLPH